MYSHSKSHDTSIPNYIIIRELQYNGNYHITTPFSLYTTSQHLSSACSMYRRVGLMMQPYLEVNCWWSCAVGGVPAVVSVDLVDVELSPFSSPSSLSDSSQSMYC